MWVLYKWAKSLGCKNLTDNKQTGYIIDLALTNLLLLVVYCLPEISWETSFVFFLPLFVIMHVGNFFLVQMLSTTLRF